MGAKHVNDETYIAGESLVGKQYYIGTGAGARALTVAGGATEALVGVIQEPVADGRPCRVRDLGISLVVSDGNAGTIAAGDWLTSDAAGKAVKTVTDGNVVIGRALGASTTDGAIIEVDMKGISTHYTA